MEDTAPARRWSRTLPWIAGAAVVALVAVAVAFLVPSAREVGAAPAAPPSVTASSTPHPDQDRLLAAGGEINHTYRRTPGYTNVVLEPEAGRVRVYWKTGQAGEGVRQELRSIAEKHQVVVEVTEAPFDAVELEAAAQEAMSSPAVSDVGIMPDGTGLEVTHSAGASDPPTSYRGVPVVRKTTGSGPQPLALST